MSTPEMIIRALAPWFGSKRTLAPRIVRELGAHGATFDEWAADRGHPSSQSGRFTSLLASGLIVPNGQRRPSRSGHQCRVYVAKEGA